MKTRIQGSISKVCSSGTAVFSEGIGRPCCSSELGRLGVVGVAGDVGHPAVGWGDVGVVIVLGAS